MTTYNEPYAPWVGIAAQGPMLRPAQAAAYFGVSPSTYYSMIQAGDLPPFIKLGRRSRASGVPRAWLDAVIVARAAAASAGGR
jgi:excisionase family DNA binding protein